MLVHCKHRQQSQHYSSLQLSMLPNHTLSQKAHIPTFKLSEIQGSNAWAVGLNWNGRPGIGTDDGVSSPKCERRAWGDTAWISNWIAILFSLHYSVWHCVHGCFILLWPIITQWSYPILQRHVQSTHKLLNWLLGASGHVDGTLQVSSISRNCYFCRSTPNNL